LNLTWYSIDLLPVVGTGHRDHGLNMLVHAPELVDGDCNPMGVAEAYWQDDGVNGDTVPGAFLAPKYCMCQDEWNTVEVTPTHFMFIIAPPKSGFDFDAAYNHAILADSWKRITHD
jgi:hypothetical protein